LILPAIWTFSKPMFGQANTKRHQYMPVALTLVYATVAKYSTST